MSNAGLAAARGHSWENPVDKLSSYVNEVRAAEISVPGDQPLLLHVAAHGPKMLASLKGKVDGISTFLQTPEHTKLTRGGLPQGLALNVTCMCLLCDDPVEARRLARRALGFYMGLDYYHRAWRKLGFSNNDFTEGGSDRLIDALVAWGDIKKVSSRLEEHREAGATEIVVIPLNPGGGAEPHMKLLEGISK